MLQHKTRRKIVYTHPIILLAAVCLILSASLAEADSVQLRRNPYAQVNWATVNHYLANFHTHTVYSDGRAEPDALIYNYAESGYHILAVTDHDNVHTSRDEERATAPTASTTWPWTNWIAERPSRIWHRDGTETAAFYPDLGEQGMLAIRGNELSRHPHIVSLFNTCGYTDRNQTDDERMACVGARGGLAHWAHPANYVPGGRWEDRVFNTSWEEALEYFGRYLIAHDHLHGVEVRFGARREREEEFVNRLLAAYYRDHDIFIVGSDDSHGTTVAETAALTLLLAEALTEEAVRHALISGHTFVGSRVPVYPHFNAITVDEDAETITVDMKNDDRIVWFQNGEEIVSGNSVRYSNMKDTVLRFQVDVGDAVFYSQAFYID